jgi:hypothetical protein
VKLAGLKRLDPEDASEESQLFCEAVYLDIKFPRSLDVIGRQQAKFEHDEWRSMVGY